MMKANILLAISLSIMIIASGFAAYIFNERFYYGQYEKNGLYEIVDEQAAKAATFVLISYFHNKGDLSLINPMSEEEKSHLKDVKNLIAVMYFIYALSTIVTLGVLLYFLKKHKRTIKKVGKGVRYFKYHEILKEVLWSTQISGIAVIALLLVITIILLMWDFNLLFHYFHELFFPDGNYIFPNNSFLITFFPGEFFQAIALKIYQRILITGFIVLGLSLGISFALSKSKS